VWSKRDIQGARPKQVDIEQVQLSTSLGINWLLPEIARQEPRIHDAVKEKVLAGRLHDELLHLTAGRGSASLAANLVLNTVPSVAAQLQDIAANPPPLSDRDAEEKTAHLKKELDALILNMETVQRDFESYVLDSLAVAQRDQIQFESRQKACPLDPEQLINKDNT